MAGRPERLVGIHFAVLLFGLAGLFGKLIHLDPSVIVLGRVSFGAAALFLAARAMKTPLALRAAKDRWILALSGAVLAFHWTAFFLSIQISSVAIGLLTYSTFPIFSTFLEPLFFRERLRAFDVVTALLVALGLGLIVPVFDMANEVTLGVFWGTLSGFTFALIQLLNRSYVKTYSPLVIASYQNSFAALALVPFFLVDPVLPTAGEFFLLALLGIFCTALAHVLFIQALTRIKAQLASLIACLEPVYGILLALVLLREIPALRTAAGGLIIVLTTFVAVRRR